MQEEKVLAVLYALLSLDAPSGNEKQIAAYLFHYLKKLDFAVTKDAKGKIIGYLPGTGEPLLLTAHMDRVPPGKGHVPVKNGSILTSDGTTNLGADDAAGIVVILEAIRAIIEQRLPHPQLVVVFTVAEEIGLQGARALDLSVYNVQQGISYDNAFAAGVMISSGAAYESFDVTIIGTAGHPGQDLSSSTNALQVFLAADWMIGESDDGRSRINVGLVTSGTARNITPGSVKIQGELRSSMTAAEIREKLQLLETNIKNTCDMYGATYIFTTQTLALAYHVDMNEPLVRAYKQVVEKRHGQLLTKPTFVASDANVLRAEKNLAVFTIATGVVNEHTVTEYIDIQDIYMLIADLQMLITTRAEEL